MIKNVNKKEREGERRQDDRRWCNLIGLAKEGDHMVDTSTIYVRSRNRMKQRGGAKNGNGRRVGGRVQCVA